MKLRVKFLIVATALTTLSATCAYAGSSDQYGSWGGSSSSGVGSQIINGQVNLDTVWTNTNVTVDNVNGDVNGSAAAVANAFQAVTFNNTIVDNNQYASGEAVGADLNGVPLISDREQALEIARLGHAVFRQLGELAIPSFAFVNGAAMGGGVEVALHCAYRTISSGVPVRPTTWGSRRAM